MIFIFYTKLVHRLDVSVLNKYFIQLSPVLQAKILRYRKWQDAQRSLLGKALLADGLNYMGLNIYSLSNLKFTKLDKPYFDNSIDFNISHSGEYIVCAITTKCKVGVDVEEIKPIPIEDFITNFTAEEWKIINQVTDYTQFYTFWTKKEAFLKAIGMGLNIPLNECEILQDRISWNNKDWFMHQINLEKGYTAYLATDDPSPNIILRKIEYGETH